MPKLQSKSSPQPPEKLLELIVYLAQRCDTLETWGRTKLAKMIYFAEFDHYRAHREPLTGARFTREAQGPIPDSFYMALRKLQETGRIVEVERKVGDKTEMRATATSEADLALFTPRQVATIEQTIAKLGRLTATQLSKLSHEHAGWRLAAPGEEIPLFTALSNTRRLTEEEIDFARKMAEQLSA